MSLQIENLFKNYQQAGQELSILKGLNCHIEKGEVIAILGQSGSGKSTLLSLLAGLDRPTEGRIKINQQDITHLSEEEMTQFRAKNIGIIFQQFHLIPHLTALENVLLPLEILNEKPQTAKSKAKEMLALVGLSHRLEHLPSQLSGGECQRVAMARALVVEPNCLLADEPSGNLDTETGVQVMSLFFDVVRKFKTTTVLVTHSQELASRCDRIFHLKNGVM